MNGLISRILLLAVVLNHVGCASFRPGGIDEAGFLERSETRSNEEFRITVAVPSGPECRALFDSKLYKKKVQPVWVEVENRSPDPVLLSPYSVDPDYFPPLEVAWLSHRAMAKKTNRRINAFFYDQSFPQYVGAGQIESGFIFTNLDKGIKYVPMDILLEDRIQDFEFFLPVPGFRADFSAVDFESLWEVAQQTELKSEEEVRAWVESLPCCATNKKGTRTGDPINFVLVATIRALNKSAGRTGWDVTAAKTFGTSIKTVGAAIVGSRYRNAPFSALYFFGRSQDIGLQKARSNIHQRNHMRLWLAPVTYRGDPIWVGQISRDIGSKLTTKSSTFTTHKIDPDIDDARDTLVLEMLTAHALEAVGFTEGVGVRSWDAPGLNLTDDPFITDGLRAVLFLTGDRVSYEEVRDLDWEEPGRDF